MKIESLLGKIRDWQEASTWRIAYGIGKDFREENRKREESWKIASDAKAKGGSPAIIELFSDAARQHGRTAEVHRRQAIECHGELLSIANDVRRLAPELLGLAQSAGVDFLAEDCFDAVALAERMIELESKLLVKFNEVLMPIDASNTACHSENLLPVLHAETGAATEGDPPQEWSRYLTNAEWARIFDSSKDQIRRDHCNADHHKDQPSGSDRARARKRAFTMAYIKSKGAEELYNITIRKENERL